MIRLPRTWPVLSRPLLALLLTLTVAGCAILYADKTTGAIRHAVDETARRRKIQREYNEKHGITPESIQRAVDDLFGSPEAADYSTVSLDESPVQEFVDNPDLMEAELQRLDHEMHAAAERLEFEQAAEHRDRMRYLRQQALLAG